MRVSAGGVFRCGLWGLFGLRCGWVRVGVGCDGWDVMLV